jgi:hypothetical protein
MRRFAFLVDPIRVSDEHVLERLTTDDDSPAGKEPDGHQDGKPETDAY